MIEATARVAGLVDFLPYQPPWTKANAIYYAVTPHLTVRPQEGRLPATSTKPPEGPQRPQATSRPKESDDKPEAPHEAEEKRSYDV
ncbi:MAG: hypothetical protein IAF94_23825 [Pirellulaceae bacterium]|nr:hypothetical protein [Pirellulaceae bacterium]